MRYLRYLLGLIRENIGKSITLTVTIIVFCFAGTLKDDIITKNVVGQNTIVVGKDTTHIYLCLSQSSSRSIDCVEFKSKQNVLPNNTIVYTEYNGLNALLWIIFGVGVIALCVGTFSPDSDMSWNFKEIWVNVLIKDIKVIEESNKYHWVLDNKLIAINDYPMDHWSVHGRVREYVSCKNIFPQFLSKEDKRENKLSKIGI